MRQIFIQKQQYIKRISPYLLSLHAHTNIECQPGLTLIRLPFAITLPNKEPNIEFKFELPQKLVLQKLFLCGAYQLDNEINIAIYNFNSTTKSLAADTILLYATAYEAIAFTVH